MLYSSKMVVNTEQLRFDQKELEIEKEKRQDLSQTRLIYLGLIYLALCT